MIQAWRPTSIGHDLPKISIQKAIGEPKRQRMRCMCGYHHGYSLQSPRADLHPKKVNNLGPMALVTVKYAITRGPPVVAVAAPLDPILPHR